MRRIVFLDVPAGGRERREGARGTHQPLVDRAAWEGRIKIGGRRSWRRELGRGKDIISRERIRVFLKKPLGRRSGKDLLGNAFGF